MSRIAPFGGRQEGIVAKKVELYEYIFDCPAHGPERSVLCFRAFDEDNKHLWEKVLAKYEEVEFVGNELELLLENLTKSPAHMVMVKE